MADLSIGYLTAGAFLTASALCFCLMGWDKLCAAKLWPRVAERQLLFWALMGGAVGGIAAQQLFRHKTRKQPFGRWLWVSLVLNLMVYGAVLFWWPNDMS